MLLNGGGVRLAPLYDIASTLPHDDFHAPKVRVAMKVGGYYKIASIGRGAWRRFATDAGLDPDQLIERAWDLCERAPSAFTTAVDVLDDRTDPMAVRLLERVTTRADACRAMLA